MPGPRLPLGPRSGPAGTISPWSRCGTSGCLSAGCGHGLEQRDGCGAGIEHRGLVPGALSQLLEPAPEHPGSEAPARHHWPDPGGLSRRGRRPPANPGGALDQKRMTVGLLRVAFHGAAPRGLSGAVGGDPEHPALF